MSRLPRRPPTTPLPLPFRPYGDVAAAGLEVTVTCSKCGRSVLIDASDDAIRDRGRFACPSCGRFAGLHLSGGPGTPGTDRFQDRGKYGQ